MIKKIFLINNNIGNQKMRIEILDFLRGLAMILVLLHHSGIPVGGWILSFHMPLFFILSGYTDAVLSKKIEKFELIKYCIDRFKKIMIPYYAFEFLHMIIFFVWTLLSHKTINCFVCIKDIILCLNSENSNMISSRLWFLPCIFLCDIVLYIVKFYIKDQKFIFVLPIVFFILSWFETKYIKFRLPFTLDIAIMGVGFVLLGYSCKELITYLLGKQSIIKNIVIFIVFILIMVYSKFKDTYFYMYDNKYGEYILSVICAVSGSFSFFIVGKFLFNMFNHINGIKNFFIWYGYNSLAIFPEHLAIMFYYKVFIEIVYKFFNISFSKEWYILFIIMVIVNIPVVNFFSNYLPFFVGKKYNKK